MATLKTTALVAGTAFTVPANGIKVNDLYIGDGTGSNKYRETGWNNGVTEFSGVLTARKSILITPGAEVPGGYGITNPTGSLQVIMEYYELT